MEDQPYHFYREPCQLCISRSEQGKHELISECGWCNDADTHYRTSHAYPGDIIQIDPNLQNYPYHHSPHPDREYYYDGEEIASARGSKPDNLLAATAPKSKDDESVFGSIFFTFVFAVLLALIPLAGEESLMGWVWMIWWGVVALFALVLLWLGFTD